jgi:DNA-binding response OmpR family regulator
MLFGRDRRNIHRILIVEDEALVAFDNEHFLVHAGYTVVATVDSLVHAEAEIQRTPIDLVVADVTLGGQRDGVRVAELAHARGIAVLFVTGTCPPDARHLAYGCLAKPYTQRDLLGAIQTIDAILRGAKLPATPRGLSLFRDVPDDDAA